MVATIRSCDGECEIDTSSARAGRRCRIRGPHLGHGAALLVCDPLVLAAYRGADLLAPCAGLTWGFLQTYLAQTTSFAGKAAGLFIGGVLLWDVLVRSQLGFAVAFLEEIWSRNLGHLMMSPLRPVELVAALIIVSLIKLMVAMVPVAAMAYFFFGFNVLSLGVAFAAFFANLVIMSWSLGLVSTGVVLRWGLGAESFAWLIVFVFLPLCCVYYPVTTLPGWLQPVALALPPTYVFEGLRAIVLNGTFDAQLMVKAFLLNLVYFALGFAAFAYFLHRARARISGADG